MEDTAHLPSDTPEVPELILNGFDGIKTQRSVVESWHAEILPYNNPSIPGATFNIDVPASNHFISLSESYCEIDLHLADATGSDDYSTFGRFPAPDAGSGHRTADAHSRPPTFSLNENGVHGMFSRIRTTINGMSVESQADDYAYAEGSWYRMAMTRSTGTDVGGQAVLTPINWDKGASWTIKGMLPSTLSEGPNAAQEGGVAPACDYEVSFGGGSWNDSARCYRAAILGYARKPSDWNTAAGEQNSYPTFCFRVQDTIHDCKRLLPPGTRVALEFTPAPNGYALETSPTGNGKGARLNSTILGFRFYLKQYRLSDVARGMVAERRQAGMNLKYHVLRTRRVVVPAGSISSFTASGLLSGPRPSAIAICMATADVFASGNLNHALHAMKYNAITDAARPGATGPPVVPADKFYRRIDYVHVTEASITVGGQRYPRYPLKDRSLGGYSRKPVRSYQEYLDCIAALGGKAPEGTPFLTRSAWECKPSLFWFNIDPIPAIEALSGEVQSPSQNVTVDVALTFSEATGSGAECHIFAFYSDEIQITPNDEVKKSW